MVLPRKVPSVPVRQRAKKTRFGSRIPRRYRACRETRVVHLQNSRLVSEFYLSGLVPAASRRCLLRYWSHANRNRERVATANRALAPLPQYAFPPDGIRQYLGFQFVRLGGLLFRIHDCLDQRRFRRIQRSADGGPNFVGILAAECIRATRLGESHTLRRFTAARTVLLIASPRRVLDVFFDGSSNHPRFGMFLCMSDRLQSLSDLSTDTGRDTNRRTGFPHRPPPHQKCCTLSQSDSPRIYRRTQLDQLAFFVSLRLATGYLLRSRGRRASIRPGYQLPGPA